MYACVDVYILYIGYACFDAFELGNHEFDDGTTLQSPTPLNLCLYLFFYFSLGIHTFLCFVAYSYVHPGDAVLAGFLRNLSKYTENCPRYVGRLLDCA